MNPLDDSDSADPESVELSDLAAAVAVHALDALEPASMAAPPALRARVLAAALDARNGAAPDPLDPREIHRAEIARLDAFLSTLTPDQWAMPVGPLAPAPDRGWVVRDLVVHLTAMEGLLANALDVPGAPDDEGADPESRTDAVARRLRSRPPAVARQEMTDLASAVDDALAGIDPSELDRRMDWVGLDVSLRTALLDRAFETWTHADDIRQALGQPLAPPSPGALSTMSTFAATLLPLMATFDGADIDPSTVIDLRLTGPGGGDHRVAFSEHDDGRPVAATITADVVDFCRAVGARFDAGQTSFGHQAEGDVALAARVVAAVPALARL